MVSLIQRVRKHGKKWGKKQKGAFCEGNASSIVQATTCVGFHTASIVPTIRSKALFIVNVVQHEIAEPQL